MSGVETKLCLEWKPSFAWGGNQALYGVETKLCLERKLNFLFKGTVNVIASDSSCKEGNFQFTSLTLKGVFAKNEREYRLNAIKSAFDRY